jgi:hypothetical protein
MTVRRIHSHRKGKLMAKYVEKQQRAKQDLGQEEQKGVEVVESA